jgi:alkanesulfonate monooxygenase SsuD/methylene tetrahydromethanopterin reductase-like flavin-dependent oxidoreductase (luciferase family)
VYLLPFYHPLRLLHEICMLDHLSRGRLELGVGRGISPIEARHFQLPADELQDIFRETLDILLTAFTHDRLTYAGKYHAYKDIRLWMHPLQKPYPPLWYASGNRHTVPWMAQHGFNTAHIFQPAAATKQHFDLYKQVWEQHHQDPHRLNHHVAVPKLGLVRHVYVAPSQAQAEAEGREAFAAWFDHINFLWDEAGDDHLRPLAAFDTLRRNEVVLVGTPQAVRDQVQRTVDETGVNYFCAIFAFGNLRHDQVMTSMRLFVQEVMPTLR